MDNSEVNAGDANASGANRFGPFVSPVVNNSKDNATVAPATAPKAAAPLASSKVQRFRTWSPQQKEQLVVEMVTGSIKVLMYNKVSKRDELTIIDPAVPFPKGCKGKFYEQLIKHLVSDKELFPLSPHAAQCETLWTELLTAHMLRREQLNSSGTGHKRKRVGEFKTGEGAGQDDSDDSSDSDGGQSAAEQQDKIEDLLDAFLLRQDNLRAPVVAGSDNVDNVANDEDDDADAEKKKEPKEKVKESMSIEGASNGKGAKTNREKLEKLPSCADKAKQQMMEDSTSKLSGGLDTLSKSMQSDSPDVFATKAQAVLAPIAGIFKDYHEASREIAKNESQLALASTERQWEGITKSISDSVNAFKEIYLANNPRGPQACVVGQQHNFSVLGSIVLCTNCGMRA